MKKLELNIGGIPAILWGSKSDKLFIAVHGNMSNKADDVVVIFAEEAAARGYMTLSFDLPEHGDRKNEARNCTVQNCIHDLKVILEYARQQADDISLFACSMGAYFSLLAYGDFPLKQCMFLSPILNMERIIQNMMSYFGVSEERLEAEKEIPTPNGPMLYWDYYSFVKSHPITIWDKKTSILYGSKDELSEFDVVREFADRFNCKLTVLEDGAHFFHTEEQLGFFRHWLQKCID